MFLFNFGDLTVNKSKLLDNLDVTDFSKETNVITIALFMEVVIASFILELLKGIKNINKTSQIYHQIRAIIEGYFYHKEYNKFRIIVSKIWAKSLSHISEIELEVSEQALKVNMENVEIMTNYLYMYGKVVFHKENVNQRDLHDLKQTIDILLEKANKYAMSKKVVKMECHTAAYLYLTNLLGHFGTIDENFRNSEIISNVFNITKMIMLKKKYTGAAFKCNALVSLIKIKKKNELMRHIRDRFLSLVPDPIHSYHLLRELIVFLRGLSYKGKRRCGTKYSFKNHVITDSKHIDDIFYCVYNNSTNFTSYPSLMTEFLAQVASSDIAGFIKKKLPKILDLESTFIKENGPSIFDLAKILIQIEYNFPLSNEHRNLIKNIYQKKVIAIALENDPRDHVFWEEIIEDMQIFNVRSFIESLKLHKESTSAALYWHSRESVPLEPKHPEAHSIEMPLNNLKSLLPKELIKNTVAFNSVDFPLSSFSVTVDSIFPNVINVSPLVETDKTLIDVLIPVIFSRSAAIGAASIRAILAILHIDNETIPFLLDNLYLILTKFTILSSGALYRSIYSVYLIMEYLDNIKYLLSDEHITILNTIVCIGLCSPSYTIRILSLKIARFMDRMSNKFISIYYILLDDEKEGIISLTTRNNVLSSISYSDYSKSSDQSIVNPIDLLKCNCNALYQFQLAIFAAKLRDMSQTKINSHKIFQNFLQTFFASNKDSLDPLFVLNACIFLLNMSRAVDLKDSNEIINCFAKSVFKEPHYSYFSLYPLFSEINPKIFIDLIRTTNNESLYLPLMYSLRIRMDRKQIEADNNVIFLILNFLDKIFPNFEKKYRLSNKESDFKNKKVTPEKEQSIISFFQISRIMFDHLYNNNLKYPVCAFLREHIYFPKQVRTFSMKYSPIKFREIKEKEEESFEPRMWFTSLINMPPLSAAIDKVSKETLASLLKIFPLPSIYYNNFFKNVDNFVAEPSIINGLWQNTFTYSKILDNARTNLYFLAISYLFRNLATTDEYLIEVEKNMSGFPSQSENEFFDETYKRCGFLLALSFYHILNKCDNNTNDRDSRMQMKNAGFKVLQALSIGLLFHLKIVSSELCQCIDDLHQNINASPNDLSNALKSSCISLSNIQANLFSFLSEQFVSTLFPLIEEVNSLAQIIKPWIQKVKISECEGKKAVLTLTDDKFKSFTAASFITGLINIPDIDDVLCILEKLVNEQTPDSYDLIEFVFIIIFTSFSSNERITFRYQKMIIFLYTIDPSKVLDNLLKFLSFDFWYYHHIQIYQQKILVTPPNNTSDMSENESTYSRNCSARFFDQPHSPNSIFLSDHIFSSNSLSFSQSVSFPNSASNTASASFSISSPISPNKNEIQQETNISTSEISQSDDEDKYNITIVFVMNVIYQCINKNISPFEPYISNLVMFSFIHMDYFPQNFLPALESLSFDINDETRLFKFFKKLNNDNRCIISNKCLSWGLCCGNLTLALNGLYIFDNIGQKITNDIVDKIMENLYVVFKCLFENTNNTINSASQQRLSLDRDAEIDNRRSQIILYLVALLKLLSKAEPRDDVFWTGASILNIYGDDELTPVINSAIELISNMLSNLKFQKHISSCNERPFEFKGLIPMIANCSFDTHTTHLFFRLFKILNNHRMLLGYDACKPHYLYYSLEKIFQAIELEKPNKQIDLDYHKKYSITDLKIILKILSQIISQCKKKNLTVIYEKFSHILKKNLDINGNAENNDEIIDSFNKNSKPDEKRIEFPMLYFKESYSFSDQIREPNTKSLFNSNIKLFPPILIRNIDCFFCPIMSEIQINIENVFAQPFSNWADLILKYRLAELTEQDHKIKDISSASEVLFKK